MLLPLVTTEQFAETRGVAHDATDLKAIRALEDASNLFRAMAHQTITLVEDDQTELRGSWSPRLYLPERPVLELSAVTIVWGDPDVSAVVLAEGDWLALRSGLVTRRGGDVWGGGEGAVRVTYSHGFSEIPGDVVSAVTSIALRKLENPANLVAEQVGSYQATYATTAAGAAAGLTQDELDVARRYQPLP